MRLRPTKQDIDADIVDAAAGLVAQHGFKHTSVQAVADGVGYSKAAVLHRFTSKEGLQQAVIAHCKDHSADLLGRVGHLTGAERDHEVLAELAELFQSRPGLVGLMIASVISRQSSELDTLLQSVAEDLLTAFAITGLPGDDRRVVAVIGALGALAVTSLALQALHPQGLDRSLTSLIVDTSAATLGHSLASSTTTAAAAKDI
jgi:AcrR family transcriptional regulator